MKVTIDASISVFSLLFGSKTGSERNGEHMNRGKSDISQNKCKSLKEHIYDLTELEF